MTSRSTDSDLLVSFFDYLEQRKFDLWSSCWNEDGVYINPCVPTLFHEERIEGRANITEAFRCASENFTRLQLQNVAIYPVAHSPIGARLVAVEYEATYWLATSGMVFQNRAITRFLLRDERVSEWVVYVDRVWPASAVTVASRQICM